MGREDKISRESRFACERERCKISGDISGLFSQRPVARFGQQSRACTALIVPPVSWMYTSACYLRQCHLPEYPLSLNGKDFCTFLKSTIWWDVREFPKERFIDFLSDFLRIPKIDDGNIFFSWIIRQKTFFFYPSIANSIDAQHNQLLPMTSTYHHKIVCICKYEKTKDVNRWSHTWLSIQLSTVNDICRSSLHDFRCFDYGTSISHSPIYGGIPIMRAHGRVLRWTISFYWEH